MNTNTIPYLDKISEWNAALLNAPLAALVVLACIAIGYVLKFWPHFKNEWIPVTVILAGVFFFSMAAERTDDVSLRVWMLKNIIFGLICGCFAWLIHNQVLKRVEAKLGWFTDEPETPSKP